MGWLARSGPGGRRVLATLGFVVLVLIVATTLTDRFLLKTLTFVGINIIVVAGLALLFGYAGQISLGHAGFYGLGAYTSAVLTTTFELPWIVGLLAGTAVAAAGGILLAIPSLRLKGHYLAMATLGFGEIMSVLFNEFRDITGGPDGMSGIPSPSIAGLEAATPAATFVLVWVVAALALLVAANLGDWRPGRALRALHGSELGAQACGMDVSRMKVTVFTLSAAMAGLAGVLYAHFVGFISPATFSLNLSIILVAMVVIGGTGSLPGAVTGALLLSLLPYLDAIIPGVPRELSDVIQDWEHDIYGLSIILVMLFMPQGLAGGARAVLARLRTARKPASEGAAQ